ncbi:MAG: hypothetical protein L3J59_15280 [Methylococcaceae bacterium]|nr:hypothetical protein [Methylococcaceae bacterium]
MKLIISLGIIILSVTHVVADTYSFRLAEFNDFGSSPKILSFNNAGVGVVNDTTFSSFGVVFSLQKSSNIVDDNKNISTGNFLAENPNSHSLYILPEGSNIGEGIIKARFSTPVTAVGMTGIDADQALFVKFFDSSGRLLYKTRSQTSNFVGAISDNNNISSVTIEFDPLNFDSVSGFGIDNFIFTRTPVESITITPQSKEILNTETFDATITVDLVVGNAVFSKATWNNEDITATAQDCLIPGKRNNGELTFRCPNINLATGKYTLTTYFTLDNGASIEDSVTWDVVETIE